MSTGLNCEFVSPKGDLWYYILEDYSAPKVTWDWKEYATCYGPFSSFEAAYNHLHRCHSNPGGYRTVGPENFESSPMYEELFSGATLSSW